MKQIQRKLKISKGMVACEKTFRRVEVLKG